MNNVSTIDSNTNMDKNLNLKFNVNVKKSLFFQQLAQWATIAHHGASIIFGDTIINDA